MKHYIFDREKDELLRTEDGELIFFNSSDEVQRYLISCEFKKEWIEENFFIMKGCKILHPESVATPTPVLQSIEGKEDALTIEDYKEVFEYHKRLVRELDIIINGENAAPQASLCDIVAQLRKKDKTNEAKNKNND